MTTICKHQLIAPFVPLLLQHRAFLLERGDPPLVSVLVMGEDGPSFEVIKNRPAAEAETTMVWSKTGIITASANGRFLYKIRPGADTAIRFGQPLDQEYTLRISDRVLKIFRGEEMWSSFSRRTFDGLVAVTIGPGDVVSIGAAIPPALARLIGG